MPSQRRLRKSRGSLRRVFGVRAVPTRPRRIPILPFQTEAAGQGSAKTSMMPDNRSASYYGRHSGHSDEKKVERNLPRPDRRFDHGLAIVTRLSRNRAAGNIDAFAWNNALLPRLLAQFFESLFGWRI